MSDPRFAIIQKRLQNIKSIIAISSGKGGVGKSMIACNLALALSDEGKKVGLFDLDFTSPSTHFILGIEGLYPEEEYGIIPPSANEIKYMSITHYSLDEPVPLRGIDVSNAIIELFAITRWGNLDTLIIDMPPGIGDVLLDTLRLVPQARFIITTTPSMVAFQSVNRLLVLLKELEVQIIGVIENMIQESNPYIKNKIKEYAIPYLLGIDFDNELENAIGEVNLLKETKFYGEIKKLVELL